MLPRPNAWSKQTHMKGRGGEVKLINPQNLARIPLHPQSSCSNSSTDKQVTLMGTHSTSTISPWQWSHRPASGSQHDPSWIYPGRSNPTHVWMLLVMSHSSDISVRGHAQHLPLTHMWQAQLQTCTRLPLIQLTFTKNSHSASLHSRIPTINAAPVHPYYICSWQAEGTLSKFHQPLSVQEITKLTISWELGWNQQLLPCSG